MKKKILGFAFACFAGTGLVCAMQKEVIIASAPAKEQAVTNVTLQVEPVTPAPLVSLSMEQAVQEAMNNKKNIQALSYAIKSAKEQQKTTLSAYIPNVNVSETVYNSKNYYNFKNAFGIQVSQTVLNLSSVDRYKQLGAQVSSARHQQENLKDSIRYAVESTFLSSWLLQQQQAVINLLYQSSGETFKSAEHQFAIGLLDKNDWMKAEASHSADLSTVRSYKDDLEIAQQSLEFYINKPIILFSDNLEPESTPMVTNSVHITKLNWVQKEKFEVKSLETYYTLALKNRKELRVQQDLIDSQRYASNYYAKQYLPTVGVSADIENYTFRGNAKSGSKSGFYKTVGLQVSWSVFDGLSNYFQKNAADASKTQAMLDKSDLVNQIKLDIQTAYSNLQKELKTQAAARIAFEQSKNQFILNQQQRDQGLISPVDFKTAEYTFELARYNWTAACVAVAVKERALLSACGYPTEG